MGKGRGDNKGKKGGNKEKKGGNKGKRDLNRFIHMFMPPT